MNNNIKKLLVLTAAGLLMVACNKGGDNNQGGETSSGGTSSGQQSGSSQDNGEISSSLQLGKITKAGKEVTGEYQLTADITYDSFYGEEYEATVFSGTLNGNGHTITILSESLCDTGLFYKIGASGVVKNLKIKGVISAST